MEHFPYIAKRGVDYSLCSYVNILADPRCHRWFFEAVLDLFTEVPGEYFADFDLHAVPRTWVLADGRHGGDLNWYQSTLLP